MATPYDCARAPLFFVLNAGSGAQQAEQRADHIRSVLAAKDRPCTLQVVAGGEQLQRTAQAFARRAHAANGAVVGCGGDGTLNAVARAAMQEDAIFGALPMGTFNYFGRNYGLPTDTEQALASLLQSQPRRVAVGVVNERPFLVNASLGLYPELLQEREQIKRQLGRSRLVAWIAGLFSLLHEHRQLDLLIEHPQGSQRRRTPSLFVGLNRLQLDRLGLVAEDDETIGCEALLGLVVKPTGSLGLLWLALRGALARLGETERIEHFTFRTMQVGPARRRRKRRMKLALDGEIVWMQAPLSFAIAPGALRLLLPLQTTNAPEPALAASSPLADPVPLGAA